MTDGWVTFSPSYGQISYLFSQSEQRLLRCFTFSYSYEGWQVLKIGRACHYILDEKWWIVFVQVGKWLIMGLNF